MNVEKKLATLNQQFKLILLSRNKELKKQFPFWRKNEDFNNNFSYQGNEDFTTISYFESKWFLMQPWKVLWNQLFNDKDFFFKTTLNKFSVKGEEVYRVTGQLSIKIFRT